MRDVVVTEDSLLGASMPNPLYHRGVVLFVREDHAIGQEPGKRAEACIVGHVTGRKEECRLLAVQFGEFALKEDMQVRGA